MPPPRIRPYEHARDEAAVVAAWNAALGATWPANPAGLRPRLKSGAHLVAEEDGRMIGFAGTQANAFGRSLMALVVEPGRRRRGVGTALLGAALETVRAGGGGTVTLGAGGGSYLWPGVPADLPAAAAFFRARGWTLREKVADMEADLTRYVTPAGVMEKPAAEGVTIGHPRADELDLVRRFEREHFPEWADIFRFTVDAGRTGQLLIARLRDGRVAGTVLIDEVPDPGFVWAPMMADGGAWGAVGVAEAHRGKGIGLALSARANELIRDRGAKRCYLGWVWSTGWYAQLGFRVWREYLPGETAG